MSAEIVDDVINEFEAVEQQLEQERQDNQGTPAEETLPEKYRNKTVSDLARMHQEAEKLLGRQAQEVGEIRKLADQLILERLQQNKQTETPQPTQEELSDVDFFANPAEAVRKAVESHPAVLQGREAAMLVKKRESLNALTENHPDYKELLADEGFKDWIGKSRIRQSLFLQAHQNYDIEAADELFTNYKEIRAKREDTVKEGAQELKKSSEKALQAVSVPAGGTGQSGRKIYRRADLINLQITDPDRYMQLQDEIMAAYSEGRVK